MDWHIHKWGKWELIGVEVTVYTDAYQTKPLIDDSNRLVTRTRDGQQRECEKCGFIQRELLR